MSKSTEWPNSSSTGSQKPMGPAPIASFEDLSDELESPEDKNLSGSVVRLPGIREDLSPVTPVYHSHLIKKISLVGCPVSPVSKNASVKHQTPRIDISRASSSSHHDSKDSSPDREIYDPNGAKLGLGFKEDGALDLRSSTEELDFQDASISGRKRPQSPSILEDPITTRKDSQCSDIVLLSISGRTSRLSSIGSQGSNQSRISNISHISILSEQSNLSRCSSPHKMQLETSFCGTKVTDQPVKKDKNIEAKIDSDVMEKILLSRKHDPTEAIFAEGISVEKVKSPNTEELTKSNDIPKITLSESTSPRANVKSRFLSESGVEYYYIPLKGPLPPDLPNTQKVQQIKKNLKSHQTESKSKSVTTKHEPKYIRIKLKPDRYYHEKNLVSDSTSDTSVIDKSTLNGSTNNTEYTEESVSISSLPSFNKLDIKSEFSSNKKLKSGETKEDEVISRSKLDDIDTLLPAVSTESMDKKSKSKSVLSLFKSKKSDIVPKVLNNSGNTKPIHNENGAIKQSYYENPLQCATVRIPLHSPTYYENRSVTSWQDSQEKPVEKTSQDVVKTSLENTPSRQNSTSSENLIFSTNFGNENEIFTTKLPKSKQEEKPTEEKSEVQNLEVTYVQHNKDVQEAEQLVELPRTDENIENIEDKSVVSVSTADDHNSSESEKDLENKNNIHISTQLILREPEKEAIVSQDSFEDELPYVPTTLPQERSAAIPILPIRQRSILEVKTCPIERPRSSTPLNPSCLNEYCEEFSNKMTKSTEKIKILLPRNDSADKISKGRDSFGIAERIAGLHAVTEAPPPLPPKGVHWISFDDIPEKRKIPKRIQTLPSHSYIDENTQECVIYNYVNPDECKCECHELSAKIKIKDSKETQETPQKYTEDDELPLLDDEYPDESKFISTCSSKAAAGVDDCTKFMSDSTVINTSKNQQTVTETESPFTSELVLSSNTSCITSQEVNQSPVSPYLPTIY